MQKSEIGIVVPCYNEEKTIIKICKKLNKIGRPVIINDYSNDKTLEKLKKTRVKFLTNKKNLGYEKSIIEGFKFILKNWKKIKLIVTIDADGELKPNSINKLIKAKNYRTHILIGARREKNRITEVLLGYFFRKKFDISDPISGLKIYNIEVIKKILPSLSKELFLVDIVLKAIRLNFKVKDVYIYVKKRRDNSRVGNILYANLKILKIFLYSCLFRVKKD